MSLKVAVAGATGFVGRHLLEKIKKDFDVTALSRSSSSKDGDITWVSVDLFSFRSTVDALKDIDIAIYLVHSMLPSTRLFQGNFQDTDLLLADNFAKACIDRGVKQIIYLGGLIPTGKISPHLQSRQEVEDVFNSSGIPCTILRAGMIVGDGGSSFEILKNLVINLPFMILPKWAASSTQTIYIDDLIRVLALSISNLSFYNKQFDVVNGEKITYREMIEQTSVYFKKRNRSISVAINYLSLSKLWVKVFGESDYELVSPLIDSLQCDLPSPDIPQLLKSEIKFTSYIDMLPLVTKTKKTKKKSKLKSEKNTVRSIQRLFKSSLDEFKISQEYFHWLPSFLNGFLNAKQSGDNVHFYFVGIKTPLLSLKRVEKIKGINRIKFLIIGGLLSKDCHTGWLEFRSVACGEYTIASINEFEPSLPWYFYKYTQAPIHVFVMNRFSRHLRKIEKLSV